MSLIGSLQLADNALQAQQIGLQVAGQNIANANTPGYLREQVQFSPAPTQKIGGLLEGLGVEVKGITQKVDTLLEQRLRGANSDASSSAAQQDAYQQLEGILGALNSTSSLDTSLNNFFSSISDVLNQPEDPSVRNLAVLQGQTVASDISDLATRAATVRGDLNSQVVSDAGDINRLVQEVSTLNVQIAAVTGGGSSTSDAVGLTDQRNVALSDLSKLIDIKVQNQQDGTVSVYSGGDYLVLGGTTRTIKVVDSSDRGQTVSQLQLAGINSPLKVSSGEVAGLIKSRDTVVGGFLDQLNSFSKTLAFEFNKVFSSGQGLNGYQQLTSTNTVDNPTHALDVAGLPFAPVNGSFQVQVTDSKTGLTQTNNVTVDLNGLDNDTSLNDLASQLNSISGLSASVTPEGKLSIQSNSPDEQFAFSNDTSHILAALGVNTFFTGNSATSLGVNQALLDDPSKFAASAGGIGQDTQTGVALAAFGSQPLASQNGASISDLYTQIAASVTQGSTVATSVATGSSVFQSTLQGQELAVSGVNIDEETINMIQYQRGFQASAKYISVISNLLDTLMQL